MKKKYLALVAVAVMVAALALFGCSSGGSSSASSATNASSESASSESASSESSESSASASTSNSSATAAPVYVTESKLTIATSPDYPPFENLENGEYVGLDIEIAKAIAGKLGLEPEFKTMQFDAIIPAIAAGGQADVGISGITVDPERAKEVDFSTSYYIDDQAIAVMKGGAVTAANAKEELNKEGVIFAVQSGTTGETYVQENFPNATVQPYGNSTDAFAAMQSGQAQAVCTNLAVVQKMTSEAYQDAEIVETAATGEEYAVAVSKDNAGLTEQINKALSELSADGTIERLIHQYL